jgi:uncharacterized protein YecE (DUF72 family)
MAARVRIGVIGWNYPEWKGLVYPEGTKPAEFLRRYAERFPIVEAASAYYGMPQKATVAKWAADTPDGFEVSLKVPEWILKKKPDDPDLRSALATLLDHLAPLAEAGKLGTLVAQFHPSFRREKRAADLAAFVAALPRGPRWAVELRDASWWREETYALLREAGVTLAWSALGGESRTPPVATTDALYLRLFGDRELQPPYDKKRRDATAELRLWADRVRDSGAARADVLVSKFLEGYAPGSAATLADMLGVKLGATGSGPRQTTLD